MEKIGWHIVKVKLHQLRYNKAAKNAGSIIAGRIIQSLFGLVVGILTARCLGPDNYGLIGYAAAYLAFFSTACSLGTNNLLVKEFIDRPDYEGLIIGSTTVMRIFSSIISVILIVCVSLVIDAGEEVTILVVAISSLSLVFQQPVEVFDYWLQSRLESKVSAVATLIAYTVATSFKVYLLITQRSVVFFALVTSLDYMCLALMLLAWYKKSGGLKFRVSFKYGKDLLGKSYHLILSGMMYAIYSQIDRFMLKQMAGEAQVGYYTVSSSLCTMWCFVLTAIITSSYPGIMSSSKEGDEEAFEQKNKQLYAIIFYSSTIVSIVLTIFASPIVKLLYGEAYLPAIPIVQIVTWFTSLSYLGMARAAWTVAKNRQKHLVTINLLSAGSNIALNFLMIPQMGAIGAALASLISHILITLFFPMLIRDMRRNSIMMIEAIFLKG